ncbi:MAG: septum formation initiator family protein [Patescibacteria group bacterium]|jgi:cell division protein FtsB|nr:septum formation initiator family protein [Patescibacteria group bacterium]MDD5172992.1 septum formation initiator family protein [Patescibacteria group bacterium]
MAVLKKILSSKPLSYLLALLLFFSFVSLGREINRQINLKKELNYLKEQTMTMELENQKLMEDLEKIQSEYFKERAARLKLGLRKPGERMIVIVPSKDLEKDDSSEKYFQKKISNFMIWWQKFFPKFQDFEKP